MKNEELIEKLTELVCRSEARIDQTNEMIQKLVELYRQQSEVFSNEIKSFNECRRELSAQNTELIHSKLHQEEDLRELRHVLEYVLNLTSNLSQNQNLNQTPTQINITQK